MNFHFRSNLISNKNSIQLNFINIFYFSIKKLLIFRDRITKLEIENDRLRQLVCDKTKIDLLKEELEAVTAQKIELETDLRLCYLKNVEIETRFILFSQIYIDFFSFFFNKKFV